MNKVSQWKFKTKSTAYFRSSTFKTKKSYIKASVLSIVIGLVVGIIFLYMMGMNGIGFIFYSLFSPIFDSETKGETIIRLSVFLLLGLGLALGFRVKLFNMGGSGQAIAGLLISYVFLTATVGKNLDNANDGVLFVAFILFILCGAIVSSLTGILKIIFNIHEVATSIILNWIIWYVFKFYIKITLNIQTTPALPPLFGENMWIFAIVFAIISIAAVFIITEKTTIGYKYKIVGGQKTVAKYAGINSKKFIIAVTAIQGVFISAAGFFYYFGITGSVTITNDIIPLIGFDGIPVALVAFNNFIGIIPIAILWTLLKDGIELAQNNTQYMGLPKETAELLFGIIIFFSTMHAIFIKLNFAYYAKTFVYRIKDPMFNRKVNDLLKAIWIERMKLFKINKDEEVLEMKNKFITLKKQKQVELKELKIKAEENKVEILNINKEIENAKLNYKDLKAFKISKIKAKIKDLKAKSASLKEKKVNEYFDTTKLGLKYTYISRYNEVTYAALNEVAMLDAEIYNLEDKSQIELKNKEMLVIVEKQIKDSKDLKIKFKTAKKETQTYLKEIKKTFKKQQKEIKKEKETYKENNEKLKLKLIEEQKEVAVKYGSNI